MMDHHPEEGPDDDARVDSSKRLIFLPRFNVSAEEVIDLADEGLFGERGTKDFARSPDWRTEADRILAGSATKNAKSES